MLFSLRTSLVRLPVRLAANSVALFAIAASYPSLIHPVSAFGEDSKEATVTEEETDPDFIVPNGTPEEIMEFVKKLRLPRPRAANRKEAIEQAIKTQRAFITAGDKILNQECDEKTAVSAAEMKMSALTLLATNEIGDYPEIAITEAKKLKADKREPVSKVVDRFWGILRMANLAKLSPVERKELTAEFVDAATKSKFSQVALRNASQLGDNLSEKGHAEEAGELYDRIAKLARDTDDPKLLSVAEQFEGFGRRIRLPGNFMALEGKVLTGGDFDWDSYRGKVVLVDFWATWCGPCVGELPNLKKNYKKYHEKGFEVVAISLDRSRDALDGFIEKQQLRWTQLYDEEIQKDKGWNHPMAQHYGINAIPAAILVDKDGKVVSLNARGEELTKLLEKLLGAD